MRILLLDDNKKLRDKLQGILLSHCTCDAPVCIDRAENLVGEYHKRRADMVLIRLGNTGFDGIKAARELKEIDSSAKVVFVSQFRDFALHAFEVGAFDYLLEPINEEKLCMTFHKLGA
ncbi:MAG: response regulator [Clostridia bacterium]|nr:response regulator [Clostridia bacterium]